MTNFNRILIALDLTAKDDQILAYTKYLTQLFRVKKIYFVHIVPDLEMPESSKAEFYKLFLPETPVDEKLSEDINDKVNAFFTEDQSLEIEVEVIEGKPYQKLIHWLDIKHIDLLIVGKKKDSQGSGITARRVARKSDTGICFVGDKIRLPLKKVLVPVDFSHFSLRALQTALSFKKKNAEIEIVAINVIIPAAIAPEVGINYASLVALLKERSAQDYKHFLEENQLGESLFTFETVVSEHFNVARNISDYAEENEINLVLIGATGHSAIEGFLFGSVTEKLVTYESQVPVMVIR